jgi:hypothetical protein
MTSRGRKPAAALSVVPVIPGSGRPTPPPGLDDAEQRIWRSIVGSLPDHFIDAPAAEVLCRAVTQCATTERLEARMRALRAAEDPDDEILLKLEASHRAAAKAVAYLLGCLRATPKSKLRSRAAPDEQPARKPWDVRA